MCPSRSVSIAFSAASRRAGTNRYCKFLLPQFTRKLMTFLLPRMATTTSSFSSVPDSSTSIISNTLRAADKNSTEKFSSSARAAFSRRSRSFASWSRRLARPRLIASSPVRKSTNESRVHRHAVEQGVASMASGHNSRRRGGTLLAVHFAGLVGVQDLERLLQARRVQQELQVLLAAVGEEVDNFFVRGAGGDDLTL